MYDEESFISRNKGKIALVVVGVIFAMIFIANLQRIKVEAGTEVVLVDQPKLTFFFGNGGVRPEPLQAGSKWLFASTRGIPYDVRPVQYDEIFDDVADGTITSDNIPIDFHAYIKIRPIPGETPNLHVDYGDLWYHNNVRQEFRTAVRNEVAQVSMTVLTTRQLNADGDDILGLIQTRVLEGMRAFVLDRGIEVEVQEVIVGKATPPASILNALAETASQQQRAKTETERAKAEDQRLNAETARAEADNAYRNSIGLSPEQFVSLEIGKMQLDAVRSCTGGCTVIVGDLGIPATVPLR